MRYVWWALANLYFPLAIAAKGYVPGRPVGLGENLPAGIARQWRHWSARPDYMGRDFAGPLADHRYADVRLPIRWIGLTDDWVATPSTVAALQAHYGNARIETSWHCPAEAGVKAIGHLGFFRADLGGALWPALFTWLGAHLA
jgi:predicted alpha/beta hydrolase